MQRGWWPAALDVMAQQEASWQYEAVRGHGLENQMKVGGINTMIGSVGVLVEVGYCLGIYTYTYVCFAECISLNVPCNQAT